MTRVMAIGLDSASIPLLERMMHEGELPNIRRLWTTGLRAPLDGGMAVERGLPWYQFVAGKRTDLDSSCMMSFDPSTYTAHLRSARFEQPAGTPFWHRPGLTPIVLDVPHSALGGAGVQVVWGGHAPMYPRSSSPRGLLAEIDRRVGPHPAFDNDFDGAWHDRRRSAKLADALVVGASRRADVVSFLQERCPEWDLFVVVMSELHSAGHFWWHGVDPDHLLGQIAVTEPAAEQLRRTYRAVDEAVGEIVGAMPEGTHVVLFSVDDMRRRHGDGPTIALLPELLQRHHTGRGLLRDIDVGAWRADGCPPVVPQVGRFWREHLDGQLIDPPPPASHPLLRRMPGYRWAKSTSPGRWLIGRVRGAPIGVMGVPIQPESEQTLAEMESRLVDMGSLLFTAHYRRSWPYLPSFALPSFNAGSVRINLAGREHNGVVAYDNYRRACDEVVSLVSACRDARTGGPVVQEVLLPRADDPLDPAGDYADVVLIWTDEPIDAFEHPDLRVIGPVPVHRSGTHGRDGFLAVNGPGVEAGALAARPAWDVQPTILGLLGLPADDLDGEPMIELARV